MPGKKEIKETINFIEQHLDEYTREANQAAAKVSRSKRREVFVKVLHQKVQEALKEIGATCDDVLKYPDLVGRCNAHRRLQSVLQYHQNQSLQPQSKISKRGMFFEVSDVRVDEEVLEEKTSASYEHYH